MRSRATRGKRPLVILTCHDSGLDAIYSSTPNVQFVRLDVSTPDAMREGSPAEDSLAAAAIQITPLTFTDLPAEWRSTAQRAFRQSPQR